MESTSLVFLDESGVSTNMTRRYGWAPKGDRLVDAVPHGHWKITTIVAGLTASGVVAPFVIDGPMDGDAFRIYVEEVLAPELKPGQAVLMDNLSIHKVKGVKEAIQAAGASLLYLPSTDNLPPPVASGTRATAIAAGVVAAGDHSVAFGQLSM